MISVRDLLRIKGDAVWSVSPDSTVLAALTLLADKDVGALLVLDAGELKGIVSERDFVRMIAKTGNCQVSAAVRDFMTKEVITVHPDTTIAECMQRMTAERIRHLPVVEEGRLVGVISIGDVVREMISHQASQIDSLENYIEGTGYGH